MKEQASIVFAKEIGGRKKGRPLIDWKLVIDLPVTTLEEAIERLRWYALRWRIEVFFKILKSGCKAEDLKLREFERLSKLISLYCILSWRVFWMTMMNREAEAAPASLALTEEELKILDHLFPPKDKWLRNNFFKVSNSAKKWLRDFQFYKARHSLSELSLKCGRIHLANEISL